MYKYKPARDKLSTRTFLVTRKASRTRTREWLAPSLSFVSSLECRFRATFHKWGACSQSTAISRKVVGKSLRNNPEKYCGWFWVHCSSNKFERMPQQAMDVCLRVLKESNKSRFDSYNIRNSVLSISHITLLGPVARSMVSVNQRLIPWQRIGFDTA